jgi:hypothetical protein
LVCFMKIIFLHGEIFEFPSSIFCLKIFIFNCKWQGHNVTHPLFDIVYWIFNDKNWLQIQIFCLP